MVAEEWRRGRNREAPDGMKWCCRGQHFVELSGFYRNRRKRDGLSVACKRCHGQETVTREHLPEYKERVKRWHQRHPERTAISAAAARAVYEAVKRGDLRRPDSCSRCGRSGCRIEASHHDYSEILAVTWLCSRCHAIQDHAHPLTQNLVKEGI